VLFNASIGNCELRVIIVMNKADTVEFLRASSYCAIKFSAAKNLAANGVRRIFSAAKNSAAETNYGGG